MNKRGNIVDYDDLPKFITPDPNGLPRVVKKITVEESGVRHTIKRRGDSQTPLKHSPLSASKTREVEDLSFVELPILIEEKKMNAYKAPTVRPDDLDIPDISEEQSTEIETPEVPNSPRRKKNKLLIYIIFVVSLLVALYCATKINMWHNENEANLKQMESIKELVYEREINQDDAVNIIKFDKNNSTEKAKLLETDFSELKKINDETVAYMKVGGLDLSVPVVQTIDNSYYLTHAFDKSKNSNGWIFGDYRNDWDDLKANTIIYGHNRRNYTMFGTLKLTLEQEWYGNKDNHYINISTENKNMLFQIFSIYTIPTETYYLANEFKTEDVHREFINTITARSKLFFSTKPEISDKILTLSTCYSSSEKLVIHAKLIKYQDK